MGFASSTTNLDGCRKLQQIGLLQENISRNNAELSDLRLRELDLLARSASDFHEPVDYVVEQRLVHSSLVRKEKSQRFYWTWLKQRKSEIIETGEREWAGNNSMPWWERCRFVRRRTSLDYLTELETFPFGSWMEKVEKLLYSTAESGFRERRGGRVYWWVSRNTTVMVERPEGGRKGGSTYFLTYFILFYFFNIFILLPQAIPIL